MTRAAALGGVLLLGGALLAGASAAIPAGVAAAARSPSSVDLAESVRDVHLLVLKDTCGEACQADTVARAEAGGCDRVRLFPALRMASARCKPASSADDISAAGVVKDGFDLSSLPGVESTSPDAVVSGVFSSQEPDHISAADSSMADTAGMRQAAPVPWGLDRINQRSLPLDGRTNTVCYPSRGAGVTVFVIDSGIAANHPQFGGRAIGVVAPGAPFDSAEDALGHGSHVAGTIAGATTGVAPAATVVGVRSADQNENLRVIDFVAGMDFVAQLKLRFPRGKIVVNLSFGGSDRESRVWSTAATRLASIGAIVVASAGNHPVDACRINPAGAPGVITVAALTRRDQLASFSARGGGCVEVGAPGVDVLSVDAFRLHMLGLTLKNGTSMASPHVAGLAALVLAEDPEGGELRGEEVLSRMIEGAPIVGGYPLAWANPNCDQLQHGRAATEA